MDSGCGLLRWPMTLWTGGVVVVDVVNVAVVPVIVGEDVVAETEMKLTSTADSGDDEAVKSSRSTTSSLKEFMCPRRAWSGSPEEGEGLAIRPSTVRLCGSGSCDEKIQVSFQDFCSL